MADIGNKPMASTEEKLDEMLHIIGQIDRRLVHFEDSQIAIMEKTSELRDTVYGNGKIGLKESMVRVEGQIESLVKCVQGQHDRCTAIQSAKVPMWQKAMWGIAEKCVAGAVIGTVVALLYIWAERV